MTLEDSDLRADNWRNAVQSCSNLKNLFDKTGKSEAGSRCFESAACVMRVFMEVTHPLVATIKFELTVGTHWLMSKKATT